jgi:NADH-quinone oxidoreductase subunit J
LFWIVAIILVGSALLVVGMRNIVHSALSLVVLFAMAAGIYLLANAEFIAIVQILIYAGAVTILILFALMLTRTPNLRTNSNPTNRQWLAALLICAILAASIIFAISLGQYSTAHPGTGFSFGPYGTNACPLPPNNVAYIGQLLYSPTCYSYVLPFEIASVVLLVAIVGAIVIGREE